MPTKEEYDYFVNAHPKFLKQFNKWELLSVHNWVGYYANWCNQNRKYQIVPFVFLEELFSGAETRIELEVILNYLIEITKLNHIVEFMATLDSPNKLDALKVRLKIRLELFNRIPTATNMILAYSLIEEITLQTFKEQGLEMSKLERDLDKFDKCKSLALDTKHINERKLAFNRSVEFFRKIVKDD